MRESVWDRHKQRIMETAGVIALVLLVAGNVWLAVTAVNTAGGGLSVSPGSVRSLLGSSEVPPLAQERTILVLGRAGDGNSAPYLTDTILLVHVDPASRTIKLVSLPRDLLVALPEGAGTVKLNALWYYGTSRERGDAEPVRRAVREITGLEPDNVAVLDLAVLEGVIEAIDGVVVYVPEDIYDPRFPTTSGGYETFALERGWRYLTAELAEKFVRTRHTPLGDFDRIARQQELTRAIKGKLAPLNPLWDFGTFWSLYGTLNKNVTSDMTVREAQELWQFTRSLSLEDIETFVLDSETGLVTTTAVHMGGTGVSAVVSTRENPFDYSGIQEEIKDFLNSEH